MSEPPHTRPLPSSPACERNRGPILERLRTAFASASRVLEIGTGTGQHAVHFAAALPHLAWQPTDLAENLSIVRERLAVEGPPNVLDPRPLDVHARPWSVGRYDAVFTANTLHIVDWAGVVGLFDGVGEVLEPGGALCIYGPFNYGGAYTSASNAQFDEMLRRRDPASGIRDVERVLELASARRLERVADHAMPANNRLLHFVREPG